LKRIKTYTQLLFQVGKSGCGKSHAVADALLSVNGPAFKHLYIFSTTRDQSKYKLLKEIGDSVSGIQVHLCEDFSLLNYEKIPPFSLVVLDDFCSRVKDFSPIASLFTFGRHKNINVIAISQSYVKLPRSLIRANSNYILLFPVDNLSLKHVHEEHTSQFVSLSEFEKIARFAWSRPHDFLLIDLEAQTKNIFRVNFDKIIQLDHEN
jgi:hypothetical protein